MQSRGYRQLEFPCFTDARGTLVPFEFDARFPFSVKRVYLVTAEDQQVRGGHAHKLESEVFVAAHGSVKALVNNGTGDEVIELNQQHQALLVEPYCWHEFFAFSPDAVLLCFSSTHYIPGESNYITDKAAFLTSPQAPASINLPPLWSLQGGKLCRTFACGTFVAAVELINRIKDLAEAADHHPDLALKHYQQLEVSLWTQDQGTITDKDRTLAQQISALTEETK